jgi:ABC-2 type transport system permease protein
VINQLNDNVHRSRVPLASHDNNTGAGRWIAKLWLVARRELGSFFNTWMGWIIIASALFIDGLLFNAFAIGQQPKLSAEILGDFFYFASGISIVAGILLAMRLIAEEKQNGTITLLYTSPVTERQIIYGKFLSAILFAMILHVVSLYLPALIMMKGKISLGHLAAGYMNLILIGGAAISITLFASALASNQLVAAVVGTLITVSMLVLWIVADISSPPFKEIFSHLALHNRHFNSFAKGIVKLSDLVYYLSVIVFFLECSVRVMESRRWQG